MFTTKLGRTVLALATASLILVPLASTLPAQDLGNGDCDCEKDRALAKLRAKVAGDLDTLANELSVTLAQDKPRSLMVDRLLQAKNRSVGLGQMLGALGAEATDKRVDATLATVRKVESAMAEFGFETARLDVKLPVKEHVDRFQEGGGEVHVAVAPLADEDDVDKIVAFSNGKRLELAADKPPKVPTLVLVGAEPQADDPGYPVPVVEEPGSETREGKVDDYVGLPYIYIYNDHENWWCGDPEIYVRIKRFRFSTFSIINNKVNLPGVNGEKVWYSLGDPNSTYKYVNTGDYSPTILLEFWEEDSGFHGGDDYLGKIILRWTNLPFGGYREFRAGDVRFRVDRD